MKVWVIERIGLATGPALVTSIGSGRLAVDGLRQLQSQLALSRPQGSCDQNRMGETVCRQPGVNLCLGALLACNRCDRQRSARLLAPQEALMGVLVEEMGFADLDGEIDGLADFGDVDRINAGYEGGLTRGEVKENLVAHRFYDLDLRFDGDRIDTATHRVGIVDVFWSDAECDFLVCVPCQWSLHLLWQSETDLALVES